MVIVYVLQSDQSGRLYIGQTGDLDRRLAQHVAGRSTATRGRGPWTLVAARAFDTRADAMREERRLKAMKAPQRVLKSTASW